jgi:hypothetical protein
MKMLKLRAFVAVALCSTLTSCGLGERPIDTETGIQKAAEATDRGKEIYKDPAAKKGKPEPRQTGRDAGFPGPD